VKQHSAHKACRETVSPKEQDINREWLVQEFAPVVRAIAHRLAYRLPPHLDVDDLISVGVMGLMDAMGRYDPTREAKFKTYAEFRIRGAMLDEIRSMDWVPRSVRDRVNAVQKAQADLAKRYGRTPTEEEMATALNLSVEELSEMFSLSQAAVMVNLDELGFQEADRPSALRTLMDMQHPDPLANVIVEDVRATLRKAIEELPEKERLVVALYYVEELTMKEIGRVLNVTESRICQIHTKAMLYLKAKLQKTQG
jgi:RNA polymerase sigma factor for flagellar operon FliA